MHRDLAFLIRCLVRSDHDGSGLSGVDVKAQFDPQAGNRSEKARALNAAFLLAAGDAPPDSDAARAYLKKESAHGPWPALAGFLLRGLERLDREFSAAAEDPDAAHRFSRAIQELAGGIDSDRARRRVWEVFFPEGLSGLGDRDAAVAGLRDRRRINVTELNPDPVTDPAREVLFTANALLTLPPAEWKDADLHLSPKLLDKIKEAASLEQRYWYDHPIPMGIEPERNEVLHGLRGLTRALAFERNRNPDRADGRLSCAVSVSVTHAGLQELAREYLGELTGRSGDLSGLDIFLFTEEDTDRLKREILVPAAEHYLPGVEAGGLDRVIGVDGEYGRHYSLLKALAPLWQVLVNPAIKATFKIDLDQVFPQEELVEQTGASAFEHLTTPLWGARGADESGREVELGLLAGALVNRSDIGRGVFTPDVPWPERPPSADELVFFSPLPQALSTLAEMMTRYEPGDVDGKATCLHRLHVTGGTTGALVKSLRRHRLFTPTFIGRAEDQAYLMSAMFEGPPFPRYLHASGLIMRHDKADLIPEAIAAARIGKQIGDYTRTLWFSRYARALPWDLSRIKNLTDPFTGCFISTLPVCLAYLRLSLRAAALFQAGDIEQAAGLLDLGSRRLETVLRELEADEELVARQYQAEKRAWDLFYDLLDGLEAGLAMGDPFALEMKQRAERLIQDCRVSSGPER